MVKHSSGKPTSREKQAQRKGQIQRFREAARELECDEDERAFEKKLRRLAKPKPKKEGPAD